MLALSKFTGMFYGGRRTHTLFEFPLGKASNGIAVLSRQRVSLLGLLSHVWHWFAECPFSYRNRDVFTKKYYSCSTGVPHILSCYLFRSGRGRTLDIVMPFIVRATGVPLSSYACHANVVRLL